MTEGDCWACDLEVLLKERAKELRSILQGLNPYDPDYAPLFAELVVVDRDRASIKKAEGGCLMGYMANFRKANYLYQERSCKRCGQEFEAYDYRLRYCQECRAVTAATTSRDKAVTPSKWPDPPPWTWGRLSWRVCEECGCGFRSLPFDRETGEPLAQGKWGARWLRRRRDVVYCSNACRQKAYRKRRAGHA